MNVVYDDLFLPMPGHVCCPCDDQNRMNSYESQAASQAPHRSIHVSSNGSFDYALWI